MQGSPRQGPYLAEDHDLTDDEAAVEVAEGPVLLVHALAHHEILSDVAEGELLLTQLDHDGVRDDPLRKGPHGLLVSG